MLELGPDSAAPAARVVVEAKEKAGYALSEARAEIETARANRSAQIGLFVFSKKLAPAGLDDVVRFGNDVFVVWDPEDASTNLHLKIGLTLARACASASSNNSNRRRPISRRLPKRCWRSKSNRSALGDVTKSAETIRSGAEKVLDRVRITRKSLERQVEILQETIAGLKHLAAPPAERQ